MRGIIAGAVALLMGAACGGDDGAADGGAADGGGDAGPACRAALAWEHALGESLSRPSILVALDPASNIYVAAASGSGTDPDALSDEGLLVSYTAEGARRWEHSLRADGGYLIPLHIATDDADTVAVAGRVSGTIDFGGGARTADAPRNLFVATYRSDGTYVDDHILADQGHEAVALHMGNIYVAGTFGGAPMDFGGGLRTPVGRGGDVYVVSYDSSGDYRWDVTFGGDQDERVKDIAVDPSGNVTVVGSFNPGTVDFGGGPRTSRERTTSYVASYGPDGSYRWDQTFNRGPTDARLEVVATPANHVIVVGLHVQPTDLGGGPTGSETGWIMGAWDSRGEYLWDVDVAEGIEDVTTDPAGNVYITRLRGIIGSYTQNGEHRWDVTSPRPATRIVVDDAEDVTLVGISGGPHPKSYDPYALHVAQLRRVCDAGD